MNFGEILAGATALTARIIDISGTTRATTTLRPDTASRTAQR
jgi:hypothetical protein